MFTTGRIKDEKKGTNAMAERPPTLINLSKALSDITLSTIATLGSATGLVRPPCTLTVTHTLRIFLEQEQEVTFALPAPPCFTQSQASWQAVGSSIQDHLPVMMESIAAQLHQATSTPTKASLRQMLIHATAELLATCDVSTQERGLMAEYVTGPVFAQAALVLKSVLDPGYFRCDTRPGG